MCLFWNFRRILLDSGETNNPKYISELKHILDRNGFKIEQILISHWHHDHIGGLKDVGGILGDGNVFLYQSLN